MIALVKWFVVALSCLISLVGTSAGAAAEEITAFVSSAPQKYFVEQIDQNLVECACHGPA